MGNGWRSKSLAVLAGLMCACGGGDDAGGDGSGESSSESSGDGEPPPATDASGEPPPGVAGECASFAIAGASAQLFTANGQAGASACSPSPSPCGGNPVGVWTLQSSCGGEPPTDNPFAMACPGAQFTPSPAKHTGLLTVDGAGHFELATMATYDFTVVSDAFCFNGWNCGPELVPGLVEFFGGSASCTGDPDACTCTVMGAELDAQHISGERSSGGPSVLIGSDGTTEHMLPFCVADGALQLWHTEFPQRSGVECWLDADCLASATTVGACIP